MDPIEPVEIVPEPTEAIAWTASGSVLTRAGVCAGWSVADDAAGSGGRAELYDGADANSQLLDTIVVAATGADRVWFAVPGLLVRQGLYVRVVSGTLHGSVYVRP